MSDPMEHCCDSSQEYTWESVAKKKDDELSLLLPLSSVPNLTHTPSARAFKANGNDYRWKKSHKRSRAIDGAHCEWHFVSRIKARH